MAHLVEVLVHAHQPVRKPAESGLEEAHSEAAEAVEDAAADGVHHRRHLLERVAHHVGEEHVRVAGGGEARHPAAEAAVEHDSEVVVLGGRPERLALRGVHRHAVIALGANGDAAQPEAGDPFDLTHRLTDVLQRRDAEREQTVR